MSSNKANSILREAAAGKYGIAGVCVVSYRRKSVDPSTDVFCQYNLEGILATVRAAEAKRSPAMILLFPWAQSYSGSLLARAAADAARAASVPITVHLDHAQTPESIRYAADTGCFDSIMVDMSHYDKTENLQLTKELTAYCHERGIATEAEPGRIEGGEDGVKDTAQLEGLMTSPEEALEFVATGIDWLAPAFGNVHGLYGPRGIQLEYDRLASINTAVAPHGTRLVLHGTDGFDDKIYGTCIERGITKVNINRVVNQRYTTLHRESQMGLTEVTEGATKAMQAEIELCMDQLQSSGKA